MDNLINRFINFPQFPHPIGVAGIAGKTEPSCFIPFRESRESSKVFFGNYYVRFVIQDCVQIAVYSTCSHADALALYTTAIPAWHIFSPIGESNKCNLNKLDLNATA